jgi:hypothetical protein
MGRLTVREESPMTLTMRPFLKHVPTGAGQQHIVHVPQPIVDPLNFRGLCLMECIPAGRKTMRVLRIVSRGAIKP